MKINEVIVEEVNQSTGTPNANPAPQKKPGLWNKLKAGLTGAKAGAPTQLAQSVGSRANREEVQAEINSFNHYLTQATYSQQVTPQLLQTATKNFITKRYPSASPEVTGQVSGVTDINSASNLVARSYNSMMANMMAGDADQATPAQPTTRKQQPAAQTPSGIIVPQSVGRGPRKPAAEPTAADTQQQAMAQGISVVSNEPIILRNKAGKEFGLNDSGQWIHLSSGKIPPEAYQAFLSQQHDVSLGLGK